MVAQDFAVKLDAKYPTDITADVQKGQSVAVFGVGGVGLSIISGAASAGADPIIAVDLEEEKLEFAKRFGATHGVNASRKDGVEGVRRLSDGGVDFAFDAIGAVKTMGQILPAVRPSVMGLRTGGTAVLVGVPETDFSLNVREVIAGERKFMACIGSSSKPERDFPRFLDAYDSGILKLEELVTKRYRIEQANEAIHDLDLDRIAGRSIFLYG